MILHLHLGATVAMFGVIWFVQIVHYPLFARVGAEGFAEYERAHQRRTSAVVIPLMLIELVTAAWLVVTRTSDPVAWIGAGLVAVIWGSTFLVQVPLHARLERGFDAHTVTRLVRSNWIRTIAWTARVPVAFALL